MSINREFKLGAQERRKAIELEEEILDDPFSAACEIIGLRAEVLRLQQISSALAKSDE